MSSPPELLGFTITKYNLRNMQPDDPASFEKKNYQQDPFSADYDARHSVYRLFVKVLHEDEDVTYPSVFVILYRGSDRTKYTYVLPMVPPVLGDREPAKILSMDFEDPVSFGKLSSLYRTMMNRDPDPRIPYYYGILQFDYHHSIDWYQKGTLTFEVKVGIGKTAGTVESWPVTRKYQWAIQDYLSPESGGT